MLIISKIVGVTLRSSKIVLIICKTFGPEFPPQFQGFIVVDYLKDGWARVTLHSSGVLLLLIIWSSHVSRRGPIIKLCSDDEILGYIICCADLRY